MEDIKAEVTVRVVNEERDYINYLDNLAKRDVEVLKVKDEEYGASWKRRGGVGAFMMLARKWDRLELAVKSAGYDVFRAIDEDQRPEGVLDDIADLRRYLLLVEAEMCTGGERPEHPMNQPASLYVERETRGEAIRREQVGLDDWRACVSADDTAINEFLESAGRLLPALSRRVAYIEMLAKADPEARLRWLAMADLLRKIEDIAIPKSARGV